MKNFLIIIISVNIFTLFNVSLISAQSIASSLALYQKTFETDISGISGTSSSGVAFYPGSGTLYVVDDANTTVYEISTAGDLIRSISLSGFDDTEGIAYQSGNYFFIVEERVANLLRVQLPETGSGPVLWDSCAVLSIAENWGNSGLEDVAYCANTNIVYAVKELGPSALYRITLDNNGDPTGFFENDPFSLGGISGDAAGIYALSDGNFLILNQEENKLIGYSSTGVVLSELSLSMTKPEGITIDPNDSSIYVVGEPRQLFVFENPGTSTLPASDIPSTGISFNLHALNNKSIIFYYHLSIAAHIQLKIFTLQGKRIKTLINETVKAGNYQCIWDAQRLPAGIYLFLFNTGLFNNYSRIILH
jgi:uncharacterized protein YjiK